MKPFSFLILFFISFSICGQSHEKGSLNKFSFGLRFSPDYSYRRLYLNDDDVYNFINSRNEMESPRLGLTTGISVRYKLNGPFALETGMQFSDKGERIDFDNFITPDGNTTVDDPLIPNKSLTKFHYYYLGIPLKLNYYLLQKELGLFVSAGVSTDFLVDAKTKTVLTFDDRVEEYDNNPEKDFNRINFTGLAGFGLETRMFRKLQFRVEPVFRYSITPVIDAPLKENFYSIGANFTIFYNG